MPYAEQLMTQRDEHVGRLQKGDKAFHIMNYPGVHPGDIETHENIRDYGIPFEPGAFHQNVFRPAVRRGVAIAWLRVLPEIGTSRYDGALGKPTTHTEADIDAMIKLMQGVATTGQVVRTLVLDKNLRNRMERYCGNSSMAASYYAGIQDKDPKKALWSTHLGYRSGLEVIDFIGVGDYQNREFIGYDAYTPRESSAIVPRDVIDWLAFWIQEYYHYAQPLPR